jgi:hypothetical protein
VGLHLFAARHRDTFCIDHRSPGAKMKKQRQTAFDDPRLKKISAFGGTLLKKKKNRHANHLHMLIKLSNRFTYYAFIRNLTGTMVKKIMGPGKLAKRFWDYRPFTRVVEWLKGYRIAKDYVMLNRLEGLGIIPYQANRLKNNIFILNFSNRSLKT